MSVCESLAPTHSPGRERESGANEPTNEPTTFLEPHNKTETPRCTNRLLVAREEPVVLALGFVWLFLGVAGMGKATCAMFPVENHGPSVHLDLESTHKRKSIDFLKGSGSSKNKTKLKINCVAQQKRERSCIFS
jgi:hypothetical protein